MCYSSKKKKKRKKNELSQKNKSYHTEISAHSEKSKWRDFIQGTCVTGLGYLEYTTQKVISLPR